jgi:hypothetical protein
LIEGLLLGQYQINNNAAASDNTSGQRAGSVVLQYIKPICMKSGNLHVVFFDANVLVNGTTICTQVRYLLVCIKPGENASQWTYQEPEEMQEVVQHVKRRFVIREILDLTSNLRPKNSIYQSSTTTSRHHARQAQASGHSMTQYNPFHFSSPPGSVLPECPEAGSSS